MTPNLLKTIIDATGMGGYVTWISIAALLLQAIVDFYNGDVEGGSGKVTMAITAYGLGRKIERSKSTTVEGPSA